jgi:hypothetical protein
MAWRFRRSINLGPLRLTLSKSGDMVRLVLNGGARAVTLSKGTETHDAGIVPAEPYTATSCSGDAD